MVEEQKAPLRFQAAVSWDGDGAGRGTVSARETTVPIGGSKDLDGSGHGLNPEELLLSSVGACFVATWAIFLKKLSIPYASPSLRVSGELEKDPAGGFRMSSIDIAAIVPKALADRRAEVEKTLSLAEKYCIISKVARAAMPVRVKIEEV
jgi:organic hydroperoxide reductase OsmC/OhrA